MFNSQVLVPPHNSRYIAWGFGDLSMRTGFFETERVNTIIHFCLKHLLERRSLLEITSLSSTLLLDPSRL